MLRTISMHTKKNLDFWAWLSKNAKHKNKINCRWWWNGSSVFCSISNASFSQFLLPPFLPPSLSPSIWPRAASWWRPSAHPSSLIWNSTSKSTQAFPHPNHRGTKQCLMLCLQQSWADMTPTRMHTLTAYLSSPVFPAHLQHCTVMSCALTLCRLAAG